MVKRVSAAFQSRMVMDHFWLMLRMAILEGSGHWIQREHAHAVHVLMIEFLNGL